MLFIVAHQCDTQPIFHITQQHNHEKQSKTKLTFQRDSTTVILILDCLAIACKICLWLYSLGTVNSLVTYLIVGTTGENSLCKRTCGSGLSWPNNGDGRGMLQSHTSERTVGKWSPVMKAWEPIPCSAGSRL